MEETKDLWVYGDSQTPVEELLQLHLPIFKILFSSYFTSKKLSGLLFAAAGVKPSFTC